MGAIDLNHLELPVARWGDSLAVRLPAELARELGLREGSSLNARLGEAGKLELTSAAAAPPGAGPDSGRAELAAELEALHARLPMGQPVVRAMRDERY